MDGTRQRLLTLLQRAPAGLATDALAVSLDVTPTAVRQHLVALERDGLVARGDAIPSGGRPQQLYVLTTTAQETFPRQYAWFSEVLLDTLKRELGPAKLKKTLRILGEDAGRAAQATGDLDERAAVLAQRMKQLGYDARVEFDGDDVAIAAGNCVFHQLAVKHPEVCSFDLGLIGAVSGAHVDHHECIVKGGSVCRFHLSAAKNNKRAS